MAKISSQQYAQGLYEAVSEKSDLEIKKIIHNLRLILEKNNDLVQGLEIIDNFQKLWSQERGELNVELSSSRSLESSAKQLIVEYLKNKTRAIKIELSEKVLPSLMGGFILRYNSWVIDASLQSNLDTLKNKISN